MEWHGFNEMHDYKMHEKCESMSACYENLMSYTDELQVKQIYFLLNNNNNNVLAM